MEVKVKSLDGEKQKLLEEMVLHFGINPLLAKVLLLRGIDTREKVKSMLEPHIFDLLNPVLFRDIEKAVDRIWRAINNNEKIGIFGDKDVDGILGTALAYKTLKGFTNSVVFLAPTNQDNYGISVNALDYFLKEGVKLIITVDNGITHPEMVLLAKDSGMDVIITDHHTPDPLKVPYDATAIINPKLSEEVYPFKDLSGAGVIFKLLWLLLMQKQEKMKEFFIISSLPSKKGISPRSIKNVVVMQVSSWIPKKIYTLDINKDNTWKFLDQIFSTKKPIILYPSDSIVKLFKLMRKQGNIKISNLEFWDLENLLQNYTNTSFIDIEELRDHFRTHINSYLERFPDIVYTNIDDGKIIKSSMYTIFAIYDTIWKIFSHYVYKEVREFIRRGGKAVGITVLSDIMPFVWENRSILELTLKGFEEILTEFPGLEKLILYITKFSMSKVSMYSLVWGLIPVLNGAGREGLANEVISLLVNENNKPTEIAYKIVQSYKSSKKLVQKLINNYKDGGKEEEIIIRGSKGVIFISKEIPKGYTGIVASRIKEMESGIDFAISIAVNEEEKVGSIRVEEGLNALDILSAMEEILEQYGGHKLAGGFIIKQKTIEDWLPLLRKIVENETRKSYEVDEIVNFKDISQEFLSQLQIINPYNDKNLFPRFLTKGVKIKKVISVSEKSIEVVLTNQNIDMFGNIPMKVLKKIGIEPRNKVEEILTIEGKEFDIIYYVLNISRTSNKEVRLMIKAMEAR